MVVWGSVSMDLVVFPCVSAFAKCIVLEDGSAELVLGASLPVLVSWVVFVGWVGPEACTEWGGLVSASYVVAFGAGNLSDDVLVGVVVEFRPSSDA